MPEPRPTTPERASAFVLFFRHGIPIIVIVGGLVWFLADPSVLAAEGAAGVIGAGMAWWLFGWLFRKGVEGDEDRDAEDAARAYFDEHGEWPSDDATAYFVRYGRWPGAGTPARR